MSFRTPKCVSSGLWALTVYMDFKLHKTCSGEVANVSSFSLSTPGHIVFTSGISPSLFLARWRMCLIFLQYLILLQSTFHCSPLVQYLLWLIFHVLLKSYVGFFTFIYFWYFISQLSIQNFLIITFSLTQAFFFVCLKWLNLSLSDV